MSANQNPVVHPDENLLAAFAEKTLTGAERESVLFHVSACERCRDIVFLAQESAAAPEAAPGIAVRPARRRWLRWQTATAGAWVLALIVGAALLWHRHEKSPPANEQAIVRPAAPPVVAMPKEIGPQKEVAPALTRPAPSVRQSINGQFEGVLKAPEMRKRSVAPRDENVPLAPSRPEMQAQSYIAPPMGAPEQQSALGHSELRSLPMAGKQVVPQQANQAVLQEAPADKKVGPSSGIVAASNNELATAEPQAAPVPHQYSSASVSSAAELSVSPSLPQFSVSKGKLERLDAGGYKAVELPAGTQARSVATYRNVVLLLTRQRALYRSVDSGEHWVLVPAQWEGKPAALRLRADAGLLSAQKAASGHTYDAISSPQANAKTGTAGAAGSGVMGGALQSPGPASKAGSSHATGMVFELTNGAGKRWVSRDGGQSWQPE